MNRNSHSGQNPAVQQSSLRSTEPHENVRCRSCVCRKRPLQDLSAAAALVDHGQAALVAAATPDSTAQLKAKRATQRLLRLALNVSMVSRRLEGSLCGLSVDWAEIAVGCGVANAVGLAVNVALLGWERWAAARPKQPTPWVFERLEGTRNGQYLVCMGFSCSCRHSSSGRCCAGATMQAATPDPPAAPRPQRGCGAGGFSRSRSLPTENSSLLPLRLFLYAFFGHLIRDTAMELGMESYSQKFLAHHALYIVATFWALLAQEATVPITTGIASCEVGSFFWNVWVLDSANRPRPEWRAVASVRALPRRQSRAVAVHRRLHRLERPRGGDALPRDSDRRAAEHVWLAACYAVSGTVCCC